MKRFFKFLMPVTCKQEINRLKCEFLKSCAANARATDELQRTVVKMDLAAHQKRVHRI